DAAVAASSVLQSLQDVPLSRRGRIQPDQWEQWTDDAQSLSAALQRLKAAVGDGDRETDGREVAAATSEVGLALERCQGKLDDWQASLDATGVELQRVKDGMHGWLTVAAIGVTLFLAWMAVGQLSLFTQALRWCRGA